MSSSTSRLSLRHPAVNPWNIGFAVALAMIGMTGWLAYRNVQQLIQYNQQVTHTYEVLTTLDRILSLLKDAETGQRGYLITGNSRYLEPYHPAIAALPDHLRSLRHLTQNNPDQQQQIPHLEQQIQQQLSTLKTAITARQRQASPTAPGRFDQGKQQMDAIRHQMTTMRTIEQNLLEQQSHRATEQGQKLTLATGAATGLGLGLTSVLYYLLRRDHTFHQRTEASIQRQLRQSELLTAMTTNIRQSLDLSTILQTTVQEVQTSLQVDRVLIFRFNPDGSGVVVQEAVVPGFPVVLNQTIIDHCFDREYQEPYRQGRICSLTDINTAPIQPCYREFLQQFAVQANLVVPIISQDTLWGLLIAHQCRSPRQWTESETSLLKQLSNQISIALSQSHLLEQAIHQQTALSQSNAELRQFAYVASHDLQEPLRMIISYLQLLERRYKGRLDANADEFIDYAVNGATRMQQLIQALLAYSRLNTQTQTLQPVNIQEILNNVQVNLKVAIAESGTVITHSDLPTIVGDPTQLTQLFQNLISNAIKFHRPEIPPAVTIAATLIPDLPNPSVWQFTIRDNGIGIEPQYSDRIFQIFQRLHSQADYPGTGIGLALCKKIVERHGGRLWVESHPNEGSTFYFTIPTKEGDPA